MLTFAFIPHSWCPFPAGSPIDAQRVVSRACRWTSLACTCSLSSCPSCSWIFSAASWCACSLYALISLSWELASSSLPSFEDIFSIGFSEFNSRTLYLFWQLSSTVHEFLSPPRTVSNGEFSCLNLQSLKFLARYTSKYNINHSELPTSSSLSWQGSAVKPAVQLLQSASGGIFQCMQFLPFIYFSYLLYLGHLSLLGLQTKPEDRATLVRSARSSPITWGHSWAPWQPLLCMLLTSAHKKCLAQKVARFGSLGWIPIIRVAFNSSCVALQYKTGTKFFHRAVPELHGIKNRKISVQPRGILRVFLKFYRVSDDLSKK